MGSANRAPTAAELETRSRNLSSHYAGLPQVLALGRRLGLPMPSVRVLAVGVADPYRIGTDFSPELAGRLPEILAAIEHPFLVRLKMSFQDERKLYFLLEYCPGGELFSLLAAKDKLTEDQ